MTIRERRIRVAPRSEPLPPGTGITGLRRGRRVPYVPVPDALAAWRAGDDTQLFTDELFGNKERLSVGALKYVGWWLDQSSTPHVWVDHDAMTLGEKTTIFDDIHDQVAAALNTSEPIRPVKTVTMRIPSTPRAIVAITGLGSSIDNQVKAAIASDLTASTDSTVSTKTVKKGTINPPAEDYDTSIFLGLQPGVVGPLVEPFNVNTLTAWYYLQTPLDPSTPVELALSLNDSLIFSKGAFERFLNDYEREYLQMRTFRQLTVSV